MKILVLGGRGFVGEKVVEKLAQDYEVTTFDPGEGGANHFRGSVTDLNDVMTAVKNVDVVINLVGVSPLRNDSKLMEELHVKGVENIVKACEAYNIKRLIHFSVVNANKDAPTTFFRTKGLGDEIVFKSKVRTTIFKPSLIFDHDNELIKLINRLAFIPFFPNIKNKVQPIYRGDVAELVKLAAEDKIDEEVLEIAGPEVFTLFEMAKIIHESKKIPCWPLPSFIAFPWRRLFVNWVAENNKASKYLSELKSFKEWVESSSAFHK